MKGKHMKTLDKLSSLRFSARRDKQVVIANLLSGLISKIIDPVNGAKDEKEVINMVRKEIRSTNAASETMRALLADANDEDLAKLEKEIYKNDNWVDLLENLIPKTLTEKEICDIIILQDLKGLSVQDAKHLAMRRLAGKEYEMSVLMPIIMKNIK